jgi:hypothetical protein
MAIKLQIRRGTASNWTSSNPTLESGEIGYETDTGNVKIGDGTNPWTSLGYVSSTYPQVAVSGTDINAAGYSVQGRYPIATTVTSNVPSAWTPASDGPGVLHVTKLSGGTIAQLLVSTKTQKAFARGYDGSAWTTWVAVSQYAGSITVTELANDAVETAKIKSATGTSDGVTDAKLRQSTATSVIGRSANSTGAPADIAAGSDGQVLRRSSGALGFGTIVNANVDASAAIAYSKLANLAAAGVLGATAAGAVAALTSGSGGTAKTALGLGTAAYDDSGTFQPILSASAGAGQVIIRSGVGGSAGGPSLSVGATGQSWIAIVMNVKIDSIASGGNTGTQSVTVVTAATSYSPPSSGWLTIVIGVRLS